MEFASRRAGAGARVLVGLVALAAGLVCRRPPRPGPTSGAGSTASLLGRVTDEATRPVPGARVLPLGPEGDAAPPSPPTARVTDAEGGFASTRCRGALHAARRGAGMVPARLEGVAVPGAELDVRLAGRGHALEGVVLAEGAPVGGALALLGADDGASRARPRARPPGASSFTAWARACSRCARRMAALRRAPSRRGSGLGARRRPRAPRARPGLGLEGVVVDDGAAACRGSPSAPRPARRSPRGAPHAAPTDAFIGAAAAGDLPPLARAAGSLRARPCGHARRSRPAAAATRARAGATLAGRSSTRAARRQGAEFVAAPPARSTTSR